MIAKPPTFNDLFDRAVAACAEAQHLSGRTAESVRKARLERVSAYRVRTCVAGAIENVVDVTRLLLVFMLSVA